MGKEKEKDQKEQDIKNKENQEEELPICEGTQTSEHQRSWDKDEPCDSGLSGKI